MNVNLYVIEDYGNETALRPKKTNPNKANFKSEVRSQMSDVRSQKPDYLLSVLCPLFSVLRFLMQPKLLNFHPKNSLTGLCNSVKYRFLCSEREYFYEELYGEKRAGRAEMAAR